jgi:hypothetical protein
MNTDNNTSQPKDTLRIFLKDEIKSARERLELLKGKLKAEDFATLDAELNESSETLDALRDDEETQFFILRRQLGLLRENMESLAVKQSWWARLPLYGRVLLFVVPVIVYLVVLSLAQWFNKGQIYDYPSTQTAIATQTMLSAEATLSAPVGTATPTLTP